MILFDIEIDKRLKTRSLKIILMKFLQTWMIK